MEKAVLNGNHSFLVILRRWNYFVSMGRGGAGRELKIQLVLATYKFFYPF